MLALFSAAQPVSAGAQQPTRIQPTSAESRRILSAHHLTVQPPTIDGRLDDSAWQRAPIATDFIQREPQSGAPSTERTTAAITYDDAAIYVAMRMYDSHPDSIQAPVSRRDDSSAPADWASVLIDSNHDRRTAFRFSATARGVQYDALMFEDVREDPNWDAVWEVATRIDSLGWTAEFRIPLSQLRYSSRAAAEGRPWGLEFSREISRRSEISLWAPIPPGTGRVVSLFGQLTGLDRLESPRRLEVMPYTLGRVTRAPGEAANPFYRRNDAAVSGGADLKYGITSNLTLTATINPDFGQVEADPSIVNLGSFETFYPERRPFFTEGAELFQFPMAPEGHFFYTRRIGRTPQRFVRAPTGGFVDMPETARILGAAKVSGRSSKGWSIGLLHAVTGEMAADVADSLGTRFVEPVEPLTHYSVARLVRDFRQGQSGVGVLGTSTSRRIDDARLDFLRSRAYASGVNGWHRFGNNRYEARGWVLGSLVRGSATALAITQRGSVHRFQRPDASHIDYDTTITEMGGWATEGSVQKIAGNWYGGLTWGIRSPGLELNDAGYNTYADLWYLAPGWNYRSFKPGRYLRNWSAGLSVVPAWTLGGELVRSALEYRANWQFRNLWGGYINGTRRQRHVSPWDLRGGPALAKSPYTEANVRINSNRRKSVSGDFFVYGYYAEETAERQLYVTPSVVVRPSPAAIISLSPTAAWNRDEDQFIRTVTVDGKPHYLTGRLEQKTASLTGRVGYGFTPQLSLDVYVQPFLSSGRYSAIREVVAPKAADFDKRFSTLGRDRLTFDKAGNRYIVDLHRDGRTDFTLANPDFSVRQLRANSVLRWQYRPGSTLFVVWSQSRDDDLLRAGLPVLDELDRLFSVAARNVFLVKASYWMGL